MIYLPLTILQETFKQVIFDATEYLPMNDHDELPITQVMFAGICRASAEEAQILVSNLPGDIRARVALFLNARAHLRHLGRAIAGTCTLNQLVSEGGYAGLVLHGQLNAGPDTYGEGPRRRA